MSVLAYLRRRAADLKAETITLYIAAKHPRTPWYAKWLVVVIVAYALSPIDLIPDFIPIFGLLDDLILIPAGLAIAIRLIPQDVMDEARAQVPAFRLSESRGGRVAAALIVTAWVLAIAIGLVWGVGLLVD